MVVAIVYVPSFFFVCVVVKCFVRRKPENAVPIARACDCRLPIYAYRGVVRSISVWDVKLVG